MERNLTSVHRADPPPNTWTAEQHADFSTISTFVNLLMGLQLGDGGDRVRGERGIGSSRGRAGCSVGQTVKPFEVCRAVYPTNSPHVGHPDFPSSFCGIGGER